MTNLSSFGRNDNRWKPIQFKFLLPFAFARTCPDTMPMAAAQVSAHSAACGFMNSSVIFLNVLAQLLSYFLTDIPNTLFFSREEAPAALGLARRRILWTTSGHSQIINFRLIRADKEQQ